MDQKAVAPFTHPVQGGTVVPRWSVWKLQRRNGALVLFCLRAGSGGSNSYLRLTTNRQLSPIFAVLLRYIELFSILDFVFQAKSYRIDIGSLATEEPDMFLRGL